MLQTKRWTLFHCLDPMLKRGRRITLSTKPAKLQRCESAPQIYKQRHVLQPHEIKYTNLDEKRNDDVYTHIVHTADLHVPNNLHIARRQEYEQVFEILYATIADIAKTKKILIVIAGDIVHCKLDLPNETISTTRNFLAKLGTFGPTLVCLGNHDTNCNNKSREDSITMLVDRIPNVYGLKSTGVYHIGNLLFSFSSLFDDKWIPYENIVNPDNLPVYGVYHGSVYGSVTATGFVNTKSNAKYEHIMGSAFEGYQGALLGHVHKLQKLIAPLQMWYPGSLIQQNIGEDVDNHGFLLWSVEHKDQDPVFFSIANQYVFLRLIVHDGVITNAQDLEKYKECHLRLKCKCAKTTSKQYDDLKTQLKAHYKIESCSLDGPLQPAIAAKLGGNSTTGLTLLERERSLIQQLANKELINELFTVHDQISSVCTDRKEAKQEHHAGSGQWSIRTIVFQNLFAYGADMENVLEFDNGVYNLSSQNMTGKTSLCNIVLFALFGCVSENLSKLDNIVHEGKTSAFVTLTFEHNGQEYLISRSTNNSGKQWEIGFRVDDRDLAAKTKQATQKVIESYVGNFSSFVTHNMLSTRFQNLLQMKPTDRLAAFHSLAQTNQYEKHLDEAKKKSSVLKQKIKHIESQLLEMRGQQQGDSTTMSQEEMQAKLSEMKKEMENLETNYCDVDRSLRCKFESRAVLSHELRKVTNIKLKQEVTIASLEEKSKHLTTKFEFIIAYQKNVEEMIKTHSLSMLQQQVKDLQSKHYLLDELCEVEEVVISEEEKKTNLECLKEKQYRLKAQIDTLKIEGSMEEMRFVLRALLQGGKNPCSNKTQEELNAHKKSLEEELSLVHQKQKTMSCNFIPCSKNLDIVEEEYTNCKERLRDAQKIDISKTREKQFQSECEKLNGCDLVQEALQRFEYDENGFTLVPKQFIVEVQRFVACVKSGALNTSLYAQFEMGKIVNAKKQIATDSVLITELGGQFNWVLRQKEQDIQKELKCIALVNKIENAETMLQLKQQLKQATNAVNWHEEQKKIEALEMLELYGQCIHALEIKQQLEECEVQLKNARLQEQLASKKQLHDNISSEIVGLEAKRVFINTKLAAFKFDFCALDKKCNIPQEAKDVRAKMEIELSAFIHELEILTEYERLFCKKVIPFWILEQTLKTFNANVNAVFEQHTKYSFSFEQDAREKLVFVITRKQSKIQLSPDRLSGYESLVFLLSINHAALSIATGQSGQSCGFLIFDEAIDTLDSSRFEDVLPMIVDILKTYYRSILLISHREIPKAVVDRQLKITVNGTSSFIC